MASWVPWARSAQWASWVRQAPQPSRRGRTSRRRRPVHPGGGPERQLCTRGGDDRRHRGGVRLRRADVRGTHPALPRADRRLRGCRHPAELDHDDQPERAAYRGGARPERRRRGPRSPLHGIPVLLKDNVDTFDMPTSNGSVILKDSIPYRDGFIADALRRKGALILGKASMGEFAGGSYNTIDGQVTNPYHLKRNTGGSSAGSGAAMAANLAVLAIGTDTSTSVRGPAAFSGIVGLRPTTGLISRAGIAPKNLHFDTAGPMARTVTDTALMFNAVAARGRGRPAQCRGLQELSAAVAEEGGAGAARLHHVPQEGCAQGRSARRRARLLRRGPGDRRARGGGAGHHAGAGAKIVDINLDPAFLDFYVSNGGPNIRTIADYRFKADWEQYLATLGPDVPKTVAGVHPHLRDRGQPVATAGREQRPRPAEALADHLDRHARVQEPGRERPSGGDPAEARDVRAVPPRRDGLPVLDQLRVADQQPGVTASPTRRSCRPRARSRRFSPATARSASPGSSCRWASARRDCR